MRGLEVTRAANILGGLSAGFGCGYGCIFGWLRLPRAIDVVFGINVV